MAGATNGVPGWTDRRSVVGVGLGVGLGFGAARAVGNALEPAWGFWGATAAGAAVAALVGGLVGLAVVLLMRPRAGCKSP